MEEKRNLAWPVTVFGRYDYDALEKQVRKYKDVISRKEIVIFGAGIRGTIFSLLLKGWGYEKISFTDNNSEKIGHYINEFPIVAFSSLIGQKESLFFIISTENDEGIRRQLEEEGFKEGVHFISVKNGIYENFVEEFFDEKELKTLVMGDCGLTDVSIKDTEHVALGEMLKRELGTANTKVLAIHGMGMRAFYEIVRAHCKNGKKPEKLLVMANFETFTGKQHLLPRSQHVQLFELLCERLENQDLLEYMQLAKERFSNMGMDYFTSSKSAVGRRESNDRVVLKMNYLYRLNLENECISYMLKLWEFCEREEIVLSFFIPPANYQYAEKLMGEKFSQRYNENLELLKSMLQEKGIKVLDLSYILPADKFADICTIDECANHEGREIVKKVICKHILTEM